jgi:benzoylformate decarboxylase
MARTMVDLLRGSLHERPDRAAAPQTLAGATLELLQSEGVDRLFGNPGTTELPLMVELGRQREIEFVLALQEATAVSMADGYARATRRPAAVLLHIVAGVANGLIGLHNARASQTPLVAIAGQQDRRHLDQAPMLSGDVAAISRSVCKETFDVQQGYDLLQVLRRAFQIAQAPPAGPVLVVAPGDLLEEELAGPLPSRSKIRQAGAATGCAEAAALLGEARDLAIVAGNGVALEGALPELVRLAELLGAPAYHQPLFDSISFPLDHPLYAGMLPTNNAGIAELLAGHDLVFIVGAHAFAAHGFTVRSAVPPGVSIVQLSADPRQVARNYPVALGLVGSVKETLAAIAGELAASPGRRVRQSPPQMAAANEARVNQDEAAPLDPRVAVRALAEALPRDVILVEEAITTGIPLRGELRLSASDQFHHTIGGGLGWGIGAAIGMKLAKPERPVVAALGDGSALYSIQGLWTAAHHRVGAVYVVFNNRQYRAVKQVVPGADPAAAPFERNLGADLTDPAVDFPAVAAGFGVQAARIERAGDLGPALEEALGQDGPSLIEVPITGYA